MDSDTDKIRSSLINVESLQKEYEVVLQKYQEAGKNYMNAIQTNVVNETACKDYSSTSTGLSDACYTKIWKDQGCTTEPTTYAIDWSKNQTLDALVTDSYLWATMEDDEHREGCYGDSTNYTTNVAPIYPINPCKDFTSDSTGISQGCYDKIWMEQGCSTTPPSATESWAKQQTLDALVNDSFLWATLTTEDHRKGCYGDSTNYTTNTSPVFPNLEAFSNKGPESSSNSDSKNKNKNKNSDSKNSDSKNSDSDSKNDDSNNDDSNNDNSNSNSNGNGKNKDSNGNSFVALKGKAWWGANELAEGDAETQEDCEAMCANDNKCSGATFNPVKKYCWTRSGDGPISTGEEDEYALITKKTQALLMMKSLNEQLLELNTQIIDEVNNVNPKIAAQAMENAVNQRQLDENQQTLEEQQAQIQRLLKETIELGKENEEFSLYSNQENVWIRFWILVTCLILFMTIMAMTGVHSQMTYRLILMMILMVVTYTLSSPSGFVLVFFVLIIIIGVIMKTGTSESNE